MHNNPCVAALPQLDRGSDYESERHRFESYTPHQLKLKPPATGAFLISIHALVFGPASPDEDKADSV